MDKQHELEERKKWIESAKREAGKISNDIDFVMEKLKSKEYSLEMARDEFLWRVLDLENFYINCDDSEIGKIYTVVYNKAKSALEIVNKKIQEEGLEKL